MFRRARNRAFQANPLNPAQNQTLNQAGQLLASGQPAAAAPMYAGLAGELEAGGHPRWAANLHAQAAHAYADSRDGQDALVQARRALTLFIQYRMLRRIPVFYANITRKLAGNGMKNAADTLAGEFGGKVGPLPAPVQAPAAQRLLPTNCPKCGAPVHAEDASWVDANTAECAYCGALIRPE